MEETNNPVPQTKGGASNSDEDQISQVVRWLGSIASCDAKLLKNTREYQDFLAAVHRMEIAHRQIAVGWSSNNDHLDPVNDGSDRANTCESRLPDDTMDTSTDRLSFLQHVANDDIVFRVFHFLECRDLVKATQTCSRFCSLANQNSTERTQAMKSGRQLASTMQLLRAQEQIQGIGIGVHDFHVPIPSLLLSRRVLVSGCGDQEYNGVYFCTGNNGNGFVFTKPRSPEQRVRRITPLAAENNRSGLVNEGSEAGQLLRCVIAKRFSNETILWYLSKELTVTTTPTDNPMGVGNPGGHNEDVRQTFSFWAKLMVIGEASPNVCRYPSQTSILLGNNNNNDNNNANPVHHHGGDGNGWQCLSTTRTIAPPVVELLDGLTTASTAAMAT